MDQPFARAVATAVAGAVGPIVRLPILGGSVPLSTLQETLGKPVVIVPIVNHDNNQHAANENLRLRNLWDGMVVFSGLFTGLDAAWQ
jgi:acetylornithine deacetylase/succinyl-diaminopimelate desuccinylase-like protein